MQSKGKNPLNCTFNTIKQTQFIQQTNTYPEQEQLTSSWFE